MKKLLLITTFSALLSLTACEKENNAEIQINQQQQIQLAKQNYLLIDVRTPREYAQNGLQEAVSIPYDEIKNNIDKFTNGNKDIAIKVYCRSGNRAGSAIEILKSMGYNNVESLRTVVGASNYLENNPIYPTP